MRHACVLLLAVGCYTAPDYDGTRFKCDAEHPCPAGQPCIGGVCNGSGSDGADAAVPDRGVACGTTTCATTQKCCASFLDGPSCIPLGATCAGIAAACDGAEDCPGGACCEGGATIACAPTCTGQTVCLDNADCTDASAPTCCMSIATMEPWGRCGSICP